MNCIPCSLSSPRFMIVRLYWQNNIPCYYLSRTYCEVMRSIFYQVLDWCWRHHLVEAHVSFVRDGEAVIAFAMAAGDS